MEFCIIKREGFSIASASRRPSRGCNWKGETLSKSHGASVNSVYAFIVWLTTLYISRTVRNSVTCPYVRRWCNQLDAVTRDKEKEKQRWNQKNNQNTTFNNLQSQRRKTRWIINLANLRGSRAINRRPFLEPGFVTCKVRSSKFFFFR